MNTTVFTEKL